LLDSLLQETKYHLSYISTKSAFFVKEKNSRSEFNGILLILSTFRYRIH
jgi:hypothetical protein